MNSTLQDVGGQVGPINVPDFPDVTGNEGYAEALGKVKKVFDTVKGFSDRRKYKNPWSDSQQHCFVSCVSTKLLGPHLATILGAGKEMADAFLFLVGGHQTGADPRDIEANKTGVVCGAGCAGKTGAALYECCRRCCGIEAWPIARLGSVIERTERYSVEVIQEPSKPVPPPPPPFTGTMSSPFYWIDVFRRAAAGQSRPK